MTTNPLRLPDPPWVVAHRGASESLPENTLASLQRALDDRAHMIELDLQLTTDGRLVAVHDWSVEVDGRRKIVEATRFEELRAVGPRDDRGPFPLLEEILHRIPVEVPVNLELKRRQADPAVWCERLAEGIGERQNLLISSFDWDLLEQVRRALPGRPVAPIGSRQPQALLRAAERLDAWSVHCHRRLAFSDFLRAAAAASWPVLVYTVNDVGVATELIDRGVSGLFTDAPGRLLAAFAGPREAT